MPENKYTYYSSRRAYGKTTWFNQKIEEMKSNKLDFEVYTKDGLQIYKAGKLVETITKNKTI